MLTAKKFQPFKCLKDYLKNIKKPYFMLYCFIFNDFSFDASHDCDFKKKKHYTNFFLEKIYCFIYQLRMNLKDFMMVFLMESFLKTIIKITNNSDNTNYDCQELKKLVIS